MLRVGDAPDLNVIKRRLSIAKKPFIIKVPPITRKDGSLCATKIILQNF